MTWLQCDLAISEAHIWPYQAGRPDALPVFVSQFISIHANYMLHDAKSSSKLPNHSNHSRVIRYHVHRPASPSSSHSHSPCVLVTLCAGRCPWVVQPGSPRLRLCPLPSGCLEAEQRDLSEPDHGLPVQHGDAWAPPNGWAGDLVHFDCKFDHDLSTGSVHSNT